MDSAETLRRMENLSPAKRALLLKALTEKAARTTRGIPKRSQQTPAPVSFGQNRLWLLNQLYPGSSAYNLPCALQVRGRLDVTALRESLNEVVSRHEILRTTFAVVNEQPMQIIAPEAALELPVIDLEDHPDREREARRLANEDAAKPFDLAVGPLVRTTLLRLGSEDHVLLVNMHHIICDGWSDAIFIRETVSIYAALLEGKRSTLPPLPIQYADYASWQREWLTGDVLEEQLSYWRTQLAGAPPVLELPIDHPRVAAVSYRGSFSAGMLGSDVYEKVMRLTRSEGATPFMTLTAAFAALLSRYSGQEDIVIGIPSAGRTKVDTEGLIGFFINSFALRIDVSGDPSFLELLARVQATSLAALDHQDIPFEKIVEELKPERSMSNTPIFQVMLDVQKATTNELSEEPGLSLSFLPLEVTAPKFDLVMTLVEQPNGELRTSIEYDVDLFEAATVERLIDHYHRLLESAVAEPELALSRLPLLSAAEQQLLVEWNQTSAAVQPECLHDLFAAQAERTPEAVAVVGDEGELSYRELQQRVNQLAYHLQSLGVGPETLVGVMMERTPAVVVALLAVQQAGGAYVPLDPTYPQERLAFMLEDSGASVLLTEQFLYERVWPDSSAKTAVQVVFLDNSQATLSAYSVSKPVSEATPESLAYVIYTSGSTGRPKGVCCHHAGVINLLGDFQRRAPLAVGDNCSVWTSLGFDVSVYEIFSALLAGATLHLISDELRSDFEKLADWLSEKRITSGYLPPSMLPEFADKLKSEARPYYLRRLLVGVEPINEAVLAAIDEQLPELRIINGYGPTEATICATLYDVTPGPAENRNTPIGRPPQNMQTYVLDSHLSPVPIGLKGELYLGGAGLARGYHQHPELTAERFVPNPFSSQPGERLYRTGDVARYHADGQLEFLGRVDLQVKLRGYRIELGEIEVVLSEHAGVRDCVVVSVGAPGEQQLAAYVVAAQPGSSNGQLVADLRRHLQERLPSYMVPSWVEELNALPLTSNGKIDRGALPAPDLTRSVLSEQLVQPRTPIEEFLADLFASLLGVERISIRDNFFDLGGYSLLATKVVTRVNKAFDVNIGLRDFFERSTVDELAERVEQQMREKTGRQLPPVERVPRDGALPLSFAQQRLWFIHQLEPSGTLYNIPLAVQVAGTLDVSVLSRALSEVVRRHEVLRTNFRVVDGRPVQVVRPFASLDLPVLDLGDWESSARELEVKRLVNEEAQKPFDLSADALLRVRILRLAADEHVVLFTIHHIISDGWSVEVMVHEVAQLYGAFVHGDPSPLEELSIQYVDFAAWQRSWLQGEALEAQVSYWKQQLEGTPLVLELPTDYPRPAVQTYRGASRNIELSTELSASIKALGQQEGVTLFMTLLVVWQVLLGRFAGQESISVGTSIAGRTHADFEDLIGFFVNTLVLRTDLSGNPTFAELLRRVKETALGAYMNQDIPFEKLIEVLQPERTLQHSALFQVGFLLQNASTRTFELPELTLSLVEPEVRSAIVDLKLLVSDVGSTLTCELEYNADLFAPETIVRLLGQWRELLRAVVAAPATRLSGLPLMSAEEKRELAAWNATAGEYELSSCLHELVEQQAARTPERIAVGFEDETVSYEELNRRANQLARYLVGLGVGPETKVGVLLERSVELVVGLLAILKAGGCYVPLDPQYPEARLRFMLADSGATVLLTQGRLREAAPTTTARVVYVDSAWEEIARESGANLTGLTGLTGRAGVENLAYVIYTSGSTGQPKGVCVSHRSICNRLQWMQTELPLEAGDCVLQKTSISFDASVWELFVPLLAGARVQLAAVGGEKDSSYLVEAVQRYEVTVLQLVPSMLRVWLEEDGVGEGMCLRRLYCGGEALSAELAARFYERLPEARLHNLYGPTETAIDATHGECEPAETNKSGLMPIGRPLTNLQVYVLDEQQRQVPAGVSGELYVGGAGVARGYLGRAELTAERFVPDAFGKTEGGRLYRTGDIGRRLWDGRLEYVGRGDEQVKVRGYRIELGEIEAALSGHEGVAECVVVAREEAEGHKRLLAYVVPNGHPHAEAEPTPATNGKSVTPEALRLFLESKVPAYMVPSAFTLLEQLPRAPNGKIDRRGLRAPEETQPAGDEMSAAPQTEMQKLLARIWSELLGVEKVGLHSNFFQLGGDSIISLQLVARARNAGVKFTARQLFQHQTIAELSSVATLVADSHTTVAATAGPTPITPAQQAFFDHGLLNPHHFNQSLLFEVRRPLDEQLLQRAVASLVRHHDALRLRFTKVGSWKAQTLESGEGSVLFTRVDLSAIPQTERRLFIEKEAAAAQRSLNITDGPLMRVVLFDQGSEAAGRLLLVAHHLVVDGVSWRILLQDLETAYEQLSRGQEISLPPATTTFKQWAESLRDYAQSPAVREELSYWRSLPYQQVNKLPVDTATQENLVGQIRVHSVALNEEETRALLRDVPGAYRTQINDALLTALAQTLGEWSHSRQVLIELEGHGREDVVAGVDVSRTAGWFTTIYPVILEVPLESTPGSALKAVKEQLRRVPNRGIGYGLLRCMSGDAEIANEFREFPRAEVSFNYLGQFDNVLTEDTAFAAASESSGAAFGTDERRWHLLDVSGSVEGGQLRMEWAYNVETHKPETIEWVALRYLEALRTLITHCQSPSAAGFTPSDFPLAQLDQQTLDTQFAGDNRIEDIYPLSPLQHGLLFHALRESRENYLQQITCTLRAGLDVQAFRQAWQSVLERHAILRTSFVWQGVDEPVQVVRRGLDLLWEEHDWRGLPVADREERISAYLKDDRARGFDLSGEQFMRLSLIRLEDEVFQFTWSLHHLLIDGWSGPVLIKEVISLYEALRLGEDLSLPVARPFRDYIEWLTQQGLSAAEAYWRDNLRGFKVPTRLKLELTPAEESDSERIREHLVLTRSETQELQDFARSQQLTVNTLVQGAWALVMSRHSDQRDVLFGTVVSGRPEDLPGVEAMVGPFINTLPVRVQLDGAEVVQYWLRELQAQQVEMRQYEHAPLVKVQGWSEVPRGVVLFDIFFNFLNYPKLESHGGWTATFEVSDFKTFERSDYALTVDASLGAELTLEITAHSRRFDQAAVMRLLHDWRDLLQLLVSRPESSLDSLLNELDEAEKLRRQQRLKQIRRRAAIDLN